MQLYCVIGYPIKHSHSPKTYNRAFKKLGIKARYEAVAVNPKKLAAFMREFRKKYAGASVTMPHKEKVIRFLDVLSPEARGIGAVNCIVNRKGKLFGYNTDVYGVLEALRMSNILNSTFHIPHSTFHVIVLGAGGAARAIVYGLKKAGAKVTVLNRTISHAKKLAKDFKCEYLSLREAERALSLRAIRHRSWQAPRSNLDCDILINATSVGMKKKDTPLPAIPSYPKLSQAPLVMDIIYNPHMTKFLRDALRAGCKIITGDKMFFAQAAKSFELWTGKKLPKLFWGNLRFPH